MFYYFRCGKRKMEGFNSTSSSKRPFGTQCSNSPIRPLLQDSPTVSSPTPAHSSGVPSSKRNQITPGNADSSLGDSLGTPKANMTQRTIEGSEQGDHYRGQPRNTESKLFHDEAKPTRGHGRLGRGISSLSWRNNPKFQDDFVSSQDKNIRGGRGAHGKQRPRGKGNFSTFGHQQHQFNDRKEWPSVGSNIYAPKDIDSLPVREFNGGNFSSPNIRPYPDNNRMPTPYNYQGLQNHHRDRPKDYAPSDGVQFERQEHVHAERRDGNAQRFNPIRLPSPNLNRFGKPAQEWQQSPGHNLPFAPYSAQVILYQFVKQMLCTAKL